MIHITNDRAFNWNGMDTLRALNTTDYRHQQISNSSCHPCKSLIHKIVATRLTGHSSTASTLASHRGAVLAVLTSTETTAEVVIVLTRRGLLWQLLTRGPDFTLSLLLAQAVPLQDGSHESLEWQGGVRHLGMEFPVHHRAVVQALLRSNADILVFSCHTLVRLADGVEILVAAGLAAENFVLHDARGGR